MCKFVCRSSGGMPPSRIVVRKRRPRSWRVRCALYCPHGARQIGSGIRLCRANSDVDKRRATGKSIIHRAQVFGPWWSRMLPRVLLPVWSRASAMFGALGMSGPVGLAYPVAVGIALFKRVRPVTLPRAPRRRWASCAIGVSRGSGNTADRSTLPRSAKEGSSRI